ncbi:MAG: class I SAM-dependent methyltransferase [bacterium]|nr:class I SAM-dependent methyltransferase [bacterium]
MSIHSHYQEFLGPHYDWIQGGFEALAARSAQLFEEIELPPGGGQVALDLGCGTGAQALALARRGYRVRALDLSAAMLSQLEARKAQLAVECFEADMMDLDRYAPEEGATLISCLGDSLLHLPNLVAVKSLLSLAAKHLAPGGSLLLGWRENEKNLEGTARVFPLAQDEERIFTSFLEFETERLWVNDLLYRKVEGRWELEVRRYPKVRLKSRWVEASLERFGLRIERAETQRGFRLLWAVQRG